jgi:2-polyprenyl-3-methyl-5-hydroxy-6-metoxy-1,4-benzoquinol methylase
MNTSKYYEFQGTARGITSLEDVERTVRVQGRVYDRVIKQWMPQERDAPVYEAACGPGIFLTWALSRGYTNLRGSDSSDEYCELAHRGNLPVICRNSFEDLAEQKDCSQAVIVGIDFIEHLPREALLDFLALARKKLRHGGALILRAPNGDSPLVVRNLFNDVTHHWAYTSSALTGLLEMNGFHDSEFVDDSLASIEHLRAIKLPFAIIAQHFLRFLFRCATRERIALLGPSYFVRSIA